MEHNFSWKSSSHLANEGISDFPWNSSLITDQTTGSNPMPAESSPHLAATLFKTYLKITFPSVLHAKWYNLLRTSITYINYIVLITY